MPKTKAEQTGDFLRQDMTKVFGDSGTERFSGYFTEEANFEWRDEQRVINVETMRRSDSAVKAVLNALKAPILSTKWNVSGDDEEVVAFVKENIFGMKRCWLDFLRESLTFLDFGYSVFEQVYKIDKGRIYLADLAPRIQHSIEKWEILGGLPGVTQRIRTDNVKTEQKTVFGYIEIPMEKLLVLTNDKEGDDLSGQSVLRAAWKHYYYKDVLYRIQSIAAERYGVGVPVVTLPESYGDAEKAQAEEMAEQMRSNEKSYMVLPPGFEIQIISPSGNPQGAAIDQGINHHNKMIMMSVLATFIGLGTDSVGSFALSKDQSSFFLKHVEDKARYLCEQINEQVIARLVRYNFGENVEIPKLEFAPLGDLDFNEMSTVMASLTGAGLLDVNPKIKQFIRSMFKLPEISDEEVAEMETEEALAQMEADLQADEMAFDEEEEQIPDDEEEPEEDDEEEMDKKKMNKKMKKEMPKE